MSWRSFLRFTRLCHETGEVVNRSLGRIERGQRRRLGRVLRFAIEHSRFYRDKYRGVDPSRTALSELPIVTKDELRERLDDVFTDREVTRRKLEEFCASEANLGRWFLGRYAVSHTSGSQGAPLWIVQNRECLEVLYASMSARGSTSRRPGLLEGMRRLWRPRRVALVTFRRGFYPSGAAAEFMPEIVGPYAQLLRLSSTQPDLVQRLREFQPHVLSSYASTLEVLAERREDLELQQLQQITNSSEQLTDRARRRIESAFGVQVTDHYGAGECLWLADACPSPAGGLHVNADWAVIEVVDEAGRAVPAGTIGARILVTNLANLVQPFIRYEIGDRVAMSPTPCACGSHLPRIERIEGRAAELFWGEHDGKRQAISGVMLQSAADSLGFVREWQARQLAPNQVELRLELVADASPAWSEVENRLREVLGRSDWPETTGLSIVRVERIAADPRTGKMRRMVPLSTPREPDSEGSSLVGMPAKATSETR